MSHSPKPGCTFMSVHRMEGREIVAKWKLSPPEPESGHVDTFWEFVDAYYRYGSHCFPLSLMLTQSFYSAWWKEAVEQMEDAEDAACRRVVR